MTSRLSWLRAALAAAAISSAMAPTTGHALEALIVDTAFVLKTADPNRSYEPTASLYMSGVYETLVTYENGDLTQLMPGLASLPEISEDGTVFTFTLNESATFSDGSPVEVEDVIFSMNRFFNLKSPASRFVAGTTVAAGEEPGTVVLTTPEPDPAFPAKLTYPALSILNAEVVRANGGTDAEDAAQTDTADQFLATASAGSGPYVLSSFDLVSEIVLERNENYYGEPAAFDRIILRNVANNAQRMNMSRGVSHIALDIRPDQIDMLGDEVNVISTPGSDMAFVFLNQNPEVSEVTVNPDFIEAVRYAIDYEGMLDFIGEGAGRPGGMVPSILAGSVPTSEAAVTDLERARAAMERSGLENPTVELAYASDFEKHGISFGDLGAKIQADLEPLGITVELLPQPMSSNLDVYRAGTLELSVQWWGPAYPDPSYYLFFNPGELVGLRAGWADGSAPEIEAAADTAASEIDPAARPALYQEWQGKLMESGPFIQLFQPPFTLVSSKLVEGVQFIPGWTVDLANVRPAAAN
ncbi:MAG: ABC transporter substrate-binding protein [Pseudomonadota bacterium]